METRWRISKEIYLYASSSRPLRIKKEGVSGMYIIVTKSIIGATDTSIASCRQSK